MIVAGDFTTLAADYSKYRVGFDEDVLSALLGLLAGKAPTLEVADVGAGTGIWTRMVAARGCRVTAVEPNAAMRGEGEAASTGTSIAWREGQAEQIPLPDASCDWLTMASSFHWADFEKALSEFHRVLRPGGWFTCLWNPRSVETNPITADIEAMIGKTVPEMTRRSSGRSQFTSDLTARLPSTGEFAPPIYIEGRSTIDMPREQFLGVWDSVNDIPVQAGPERWEQIRRFIRQRTEGESTIASAYVTRAWSSRRLG